MLIVPGYDKWEQFLISCDDSACSGLGSCDHCNKKMYPHRGKYLKSYMYTYTQNKTEIKNGTIVMPKLHWIAADTAKEFNLEEFHRNKCQSQNTIKSCDCDTALLFRTMYYDVNDVELSLDMIYAVYLKFNRHK